MFLVDWLYGVLASLGLWQKEAKILFLGLDNAGKTTLLHMLKDERLVQHQPTEYPTSGEFSIGKIKFKAFDLGRHQIVRRVCNDYCAKVDAVVYLVNCDYRTMIRKSKTELDDLLSEEALANVPFLILGNKSDISENELISGNELMFDISQNELMFIISGNRLMFDISENMLCLGLGLTNLTTGKGKVNLANSNVRPLEVFMCSNETRKDYEDGFKWLSQYIK